MLQRYPPCTGWNSPLYDLAMEPGYSLWPQSRISSLRRRMRRLLIHVYPAAPRTGRVLLALQDGDVLVYATTRGKSKAGCLFQHAKSARHIRISFEAIKRLIFWQDTSDLGVSSSVGVYAWRANAQSASDCIVLPKWRILGDLVKTENKVTKPSKPMSFFVAFSAEACDLALKFPHVSVLPFKLHSFRGSGVCCCFRLYFGALT